MPAFITHVLFGERVAKALPAEIRLLVEAHPAEFFWGLQGPDLLFFRDAVLGKSPLPGIGGVMHRDKTAELFTGMAKYVRRRRTLAKGDDESLSSYFMGFLCHYVLDSTTHPYVYYMQERRKSYVPKKAWGGIHNHIESQIDTALYQLIKDEPVVKFRIPKEYKKPLQERSIGRMYRQVLHHVYGIEVESADVAKSFDDTRFFMSAVTHGGLIPAVKVLEQAVFGKVNAFSAHMRPAEVSEDVLNENRGLWTAAYEPDYPKNSSFMELLEEAEETAVHALCAWYEGLNSGVLPDWTGCPNFDLGNPNDCAKA